MTKQELHDILIKNGWTQEKPHMGYDVYKKSAYSIYIDDIHVHPVRLEELLYPLYLKYSEVLQIGSKIYLYDRSTYNHKIIISMGENK